ncbi:MAG: gamma carbonic anhydrase family protein [Rhodospirillaceae bacterium]|jgi:gamma-carbonic anhydrase|nr:gamma carbonic anhydrase family protein [Rhodospirillaceae bacterium]
MPTIAKDAFVAPNATLVGAMTIGALSSVWFNVVLRGDVNFIRVGERTNIQDGTIVHVSSRKDHPTVIGSDVLIGHMAMIHACILEDGCFVGMSATVMDGAVIEAGAMVAAGALVPPGKKVGAGQLWAGTPAKYVRDLTDIEKSAFPQQIQRYVDLGQTYRALTTE